MGHADLQVVLGASDTDKEESPFFFQLFGTRLRTSVGQDPVFDGDDEDVGKFEPLAGVKGHEGDSVAGRFPRVGIADQADLFEELFEPHPWFGDGIGFGGVGQKFIDVFLNGVIG